MNNREEYEQEIDLRDLLFHILYRWRRILLAAVLVCGLAAGYAVFSNAASPAEGNPQGEEQQAAEGEQGAQQGESAEKAADPVKYAAAGFLGGAFILAFWYGMGYVLSDKLREERELRERYGYYLLGTVPRERKKRLFGGIDRLLEKWDRGSEGITPEEACWIISINIINLARTGGTFLVTGTVGIERLQELVEIISSQVENVALTAGADMNRTAGTLEALAECDAVILVEERGRSLRREIQKEQESIAALEKPVVGYVVL